MSGKTCWLCSQDVENLHEHRKSEVHKMNFLKYCFRTNQDELIENKRNVKVSMMNIGEYFPKASISVDVETEVVLTFCIEVTDGEVVFADYHFLEKLLCKAELSDDHKVHLGETVVKIHEDTPYYVKVSVTSNMVGVFPGVLAFLFMENEHSNAFFHIVRVLEINCNDQVVKESAATEAYDPKRRFNITPKAKDILKGKNLDKLSEKLNRLKFKRILPEIYIPAEVITVIKAIENINSGARVPSKLAHIDRNLRDVLSEPLTWSNYDQLFKLLVHFEKLQMDQDIRMYDMKDVTMDQAQGMLQLVVPGLEENRPSVLRGDRIYVRIANEFRNKIDKEYEGIVHLAEATKVVLGFGEELLEKHIKGLKYNVRFTYNLWPLRHTLLALDNCKKNGLENVLFPTLETAARCILLAEPSLKLRLFNRALEANDEQKMAVKHIVLGSSLPAPYLLFGPPGTGKTNTVVEAIKQVWCSFTDARILVCTPSNSASDLITERLLQHVDSKDILRFYSTSRKWKQVPQKLKDAGVTNYNDICSSFFYPAVDEMTNFKIVISTLVNSGRLVLGGFPKNHFTHIFIDESGHSVEPEAIIPVSALLECKDFKSKKLGGQLVLAGDPKQLGPVIRSNTASIKGLDTSILKRLMETCPVYSKTKCGDIANVLTKLIRNYRSHPDILYLPNLIFYEGELEAHADKLMRESLCNWEHLPKKGFPLIFHGVNGKDQREKKSPSYFNPQEVAVVVEYVKKLRESKFGMRVEAKDIGVITPYRQQVYKIRNQLRNLNLTEVSAGSVDEFQGQERKVIIISTVRSNTQLMALDRDYRLGFVQNPERFNVAVTRAKALLIIVGNPKVLSKDSNWRSMIQFCIKNGNYVGVRYEPPELEAQDLVERFSRMHLCNDVDTGDYYSEISHRAQQEDPQWRAEM